MNFKKFIAGVCAVLFVVTGMVALFLFNIERKVFDAATYKQAFETENLYARMPGILAHTLYTSVGQKENADPYLKALTVQDWEASITVLLPPDQLKTISDNALDSTFNYWNGKSDSASVPILSIKNQLAGPQGLEVIRRILSAQPDCTTQQLLQMGLGFLGGDVGLCNPPEQMLGLMTPVIESQLQIMVNTLPDEVTLIPGDRSNTPNDPRVALNRVRILMKITPIFPLIFLLGILIFTLPNIRDWLNRTGVSFLLIGAASVVIALIGAPILGWVIQRAMQSQGAGFMPSILFATLNETVSAVTSQILKSVLIEGAILLVLGLGAIVLAIVLKQREEPMVVGR